MPYLTPCGALYTGWRLRLPVSFSPSWEGFLPRFLSLGVGLRFCLVVSCGPSRGARAIFLAPVGCASPISASPIPAAVLAARLLAAVSVPLLEVGAARVCQYLAFPFGPVAQELGRIRAWIPPPVGVFICNALDLNENADATADIVGLSGRAVHLMFKSGRVDLHVCPVFSGDMVQVRI